MTACAQALSAEVPSTSSTERPRCVLIAYSVTGIEVSRATGLRSIG
jgi:hypothetical protein